MYKTALGSFSLVVVLAGCGYSDGVSVHAGDSGYYYNYKTVPEAPTIDSLVPGDRKLLAYFHGAAETFSTVCNITATGASARTAGSSKSPTIVDSLQNDIEYRCSVWAFNGSRPSKTGSASLNATPRAP